MWKVDVESVSLKSQTVDGSIDRQWTRQEAVNWTVQKYIKLTVRTTESNSVRWFGSVPKIVVQSGPNEQKWTVLGQSGRSFE